MDKVKALIVAGLSISTAIKESLGMTLSDFADKHGFPRPVLSDVLNGSRRATEQHLEALRAHMGGTRLEWQELLFAAGAPDHIPQRELLDWLASRVGAEPLRASA